MVCGDDGPGRRMYYRWITQVIILCIMKKSLTVKQKIRNNCLAYKEKKGYSQPLHIVPESVNKSKYQVYELDVLASLMGHEVISYLCIVKRTQIELIGVELKMKWRNKIKHLRYDIYVLLKEAVDNISVDYWQKCVIHAERFKRKIYR